jgi:membrane-associated protein
MMQSETIARTHSWAIRAGVAVVTYGRFLVYNIAGGIARVTLFVLAGYLFGNLPMVRENFSYVIVAIIIPSVLPLVWELMKERARTLR